MNHMYVMDGLYVGGQEATLVCFGPKGKETEKQVRRLARDLERGYRVSVRGQKGVNE